MSGQVPGKLYVGQVLERIEQGSFKGHDLKPTQHWIVTEVKTSNDLGEWPVLERDGKSMPYSCWHESKTRWKNVVHNECGNCSEPIYTPDEYLCSDCRAKVPMSSRMIAQANESPIILDLSSRPSRLTFSGPDGLEYFTIDSDDLTKPVIDALKRLIAETL